GRGPGPCLWMSAASSTVVLNAGGMQKVLTRVEVWAAPSLRHTPTGVPTSVMVRAGPWPNASDVRCRPFVNGAVLHWASAVQGTAGGPWKLRLNCWPQKPQKTKGARAPRFPTHTTTANLPTTPACYTSPRGGADRYNPHPPHRRLPPLPPPPPP